MVRSPVTSARAGIRRAIKDRVAGGDLAALIIQALHPLAMAGVAGHSAHQAYGPRESLSDRDADTYVAQLGAIDARLAGPLKVAYGTLAPSAVAIEHPAHDAGQAERFRRSVVGNRAS